MLKVFKASFETPIGSPRCDELRIVSDTLEAAMVRVAQECPDKVIRWASLEGDCILDERVVRAVTHDSEQPSE